jgi:phospholipid-binding lipoprotein MlaA
MKDGSLKAIALGLVAVSLTACVSVPQKTPGDPWESGNRAMWKVNETLDRAALKPTAKVYQKVTPDWFRKGVGNFFNNLSYPWTVVNQALQGKFAEAGSDLGRFMINTIYGVGGVIDVASMDGIPIHDEDLGQTLGTWGVPPGPFMMVPFIGPSTVRDFPSRFAENFAQPFYWYDAGNERWFSLILNTVDDRARLLPLDKTLEGVFDRYAFVRNAYLQRRLYQVHDGQLPEELLDEGLEDPEAGLEDPEADLEDPEPEATEAAKDPAPAPAQ